jgi:endothelin-converting enzyme/putative endopeptidase
VRATTLHFFVPGLLFPVLLAAQPAPDGPLASLPYTPSLAVQYMNRSVDPCVDFYQFSCGKWSQLNPIPADQASWDVYGKLHYENQRFLWGLLDAASKPDASRTANEQKIGDFFAACMDEATIEKLGAAPLKPDLDEIVALKNVSQMPPLLAKLQLTSGGILFGFGSNQDFSDSSQVIAFAAAGGLGLPDRDYYLKTDAKSVETRAKYLEHVQRMFELLGDAPATAKSEAEIVMSMETELAKASLTRVERRDPYKLFHKYTRAQLTEMAPALGWNEFLATAGLPKVDVVNVTEPAFFKEVQHLLTARPIGDWKSYLRWHVAHSRSSYLSRPFVDANFNFYSKYLRGVKEQQPRWKRCVQWVDRDLGEALGQVFAAKTFTPETKARALAMTHQIEKAMEEDLGQLTWMGDATKKQAFEKLHGIMDKIGYPDQWRDYSSVTITRADFLGNVDRASIFESRREFAKIGKPVDRGEWGMTPPTVNAYYSAQMNNINFPAGVLQPPLFDPKLDDAPNYGNTGATIGHELTHGFDDKGRQFDAKGNLRDWWTKDDAAEFEKRAACVSDQYSQYTVVDDIKINGKLTLGEDVADLGGTLLAYMAWKTATRGQDLKSADGLTPDQRFFVGMAQWACGDERPESKRANAITNPHSPLEYRINGVVSNMPEFANAFSCKAGQPMVRQTVCRVW